jgi:hypothetical protein
MGNNNCNLVLQYMCGTKDTVRDGYGATQTETTQNTPPDTAGSVEYQRKTAAGEYVYGLHEPFEFYQNCRTRFRNKGLYTANKAVSNRMDSIIPGQIRNDGDGATASRQNQNGNNRRTTPSQNGGRNHGYECPEERDYYPYWHATPWKDIAILTSDTFRCPYYARESQNVQERWECTDKIQNNENTCNAIGNAQWVRVAPHGIPAPECLPAPWNRDNHLGNGLDGHASRYNWTIPDDVNEACVLRLRYNISTRDGDKDYWDLLSGDSGKLKAPVSDDPRPFISGNRDTTVEEVNGYDTPATPSNIWMLEMNINTNQFGRTFQDRSHTFEIRARTGVAPGARIFNLNVRGKRGNIVETYPGTEYDFVPTSLFVKSNDYVHIQWTGCDNNPDRQNNGNGEKATDRSNILPLKGDKAGSNLPYSLNETTMYTLFDFPTMQNLAWLGQQECETYEQIKNRVGQNNNNGRDNDRKNCGTLNGVLDAKGVRTPYFDGGLVKIGGTGSFHYMSSRNNDFSNRSHKAFIISESLVAPFGIALMVVGGVAFGGSVCVALMVKFMPASPLAAAAL